MPLISVDGDGEVWLQEYGSGNEIVLASASGFSRYPALLADEPANCHVYTVQARGFGRSSRCAEPPSTGWLDQWADDVVRAADHLGVDRFVYTGVSHGAGIGWHLTRRHRDRLKAFVCVVGTPHDRFGDTSSSAGRRAIVANRQNADVIEEQFRLIGGPTDTIEQATLRDRTISRLVESTLNLDDEEGRINQGMPFPEATTNDELADALRQIDLPLLILAGLRDGVVSIESTLRAATSVRGAVAVLYEDEGHFIAHERPERLVAPIASFLAGLTTRQNARVL